MATPDAGDLAETSLDAQNLDIGFTTACAGRQQVAEVAHKVPKSPVIDAQDVTARTGLQQDAEAVHKVLKSPFIDAQGATAYAGRH